MKYLLAKTLTLAVALFSQTALANFNVDGEATLTYPTGSTKNIEFDFAFDNINGQKTFIAGPYKVPVDEVPETFSLAVYLVKGEHALVQEFGQGYFTEFTYKFGDEVITLKKVKDRDVKGNYVFKYKKKTYLFDSNIVQIVFSFDNNGITGVKFDGALKDLALGK